MAPVPGGGDVTGGWRCRHSSCEQPDVDQSARGQAGTASHAARTRASRSLKKLFFFRTLTGAGRGRGALTRRPARGWRRGRGHHICWQSFQLLGRRALPRRAASAATTAATTATTTTALLLPLQLDGFKTLAHPGHSRLQIGLAPRDGGAIAALLWSLTAAFSSLTVAPGSLTATRKRL